MKVGVPIPNSMNGLYGKKYDDDFFKALWKKELYDKCPDVEFVPMAMMGAKP